MAVIKPYKAIRPAADKVAFVASRSYEEYAKEELKAILKYNPFSFLHIINPGFKFHKTISGKDRFKLVKNRYLEFLEEGVLIQDDSPCFYLYDIEKGSLRSQGIFAAASIADYRDDTIKKHESTLLKRERLFAEYLNVVGFNAEPVLMTYPDNDTIATIIKQEAQKPTCNDFTTLDKVRHRMWRISEPDTINRLQQAFSTIDSLYIADGHHRSASSNRLAEALDPPGQAIDGTQKHHYFMGYLIPESEIKIYEFNRMVKDLNGLDKEEFLIQLDEYFRIEKKSDGIYKPSKKHHFSMYLDGEFYSLYLRKKVYRFTDALSKLDTHILYQTILGPILGIKNLRNDKRISYGYGKYNVMHMKDTIDKGQFAVGFSLVPITIDEIKAIANAGLVMPPKSTFIEPKLRSGLTIYEL
ncbi:MAG: DUF1015 domain-containing protein [Flavobacteriaceae bacterium]|nr:DUF1015 domain-containing protein [Flavobacteriaceae bacterium]